VHLVEAQLVLDDEQGKDSAGETHGEAEQVDE
jgi:hypothetical protein